MANTLQRAILIFLSMLMFLGGCTTLQPVEMPQDGSRLLPVNVGSHVQATTRDGRVLDFQVTAVTADELRGVDAQNKEVSVARADLTTLSVEKTSTGKTAGLVAGVAIAIAFIGTVIAGHEIGDAIGEAAK